MENQISAIALEGQTSISEAITSMVSSVTSSISDIIPIVLPICATIVIATLAVKLFKRFAKG